MWPVLSLSWPQSLLMSLTATITGSHLGRQNITGYLLFFFDSVLHPFQDYFSSLDGPISRCGQNRRTSRKTTGAANYRLSSL